MDLIEAVSRAICGADKFAPDPDAPIYIKMKKAKAWEARKEMASAAILAIGAFNTPPRSYPVQVGAIKMGPNSAWHKDED